MTGTQPSGGAEPLITKARTLPSSPAADLTLTPCLWFPEAQHQHRLCLKPVNGSYLFQDGAAHLLFTPTQGLGSATAGLKIGRLLRARSFVLESAARMKSQICSVL